MKMNFDSCENRNVKATILCPAVVVDCFLHSAILHSRADSLHVWIRDMINKAGMHGKSMK